MAPTPLKEQRRKADDHFGKAGWQSEHGGGPGVGTPQPNRSPTPVPQARRWPNSSFRSVQKIASKGFEQEVSSGQPFRTETQAPSARQNPQRNGPYEVDQFTSKKIPAGPSPPAPARIAPDHDGDEASRKRR